MKQHHKIKLELLAPAKNAQTAIEAIKHGADAVYMGASKYGARASAGNTLQDIKTAVDYAHKFNARIYVTVNTILFEDELNDVEHLIQLLYQIGVDALIVQDMGILRMNLPPIPLHASTQCDLRTPEKAEFLEQCGFSQIVMARELTLHEIKAIRNKVSVQLEAFIHGALCVSYSGRCGISYACMKRSANRGECAQVCRLSYNLEDDNGNILIKDKHLLSLKDMNQSQNLEDLILAGVSSFKIEGRLKDEDYVKNVVAFYSQKLNRFIAENSERYERASSGTSEYSFIPKLNKVFNRSFTSYFLKNRNLSNGESIASISTPKSIGEYIGKISLAKGCVLKISTTEKLSNGDGLSFFNKQGVYSGFRINKVIGDTIYCSQPINIEKGTKIYRTYDKNFNDILNRNSAERRISLNMVLRYNNHVLSLDLHDERNNSVTVSYTLNKHPELAKTEQSSKQNDILRKLGNTIYEAKNVQTLGEYFIPNSILAELRRSGIERLESSQIINYDFEYRKTENKNFPFYTDTLTYVDNVSNSLSKKFYQEHGVKNITCAIESTDYKLQGDEVLMHTRYCVLKELGFCKKNKKSIKLPQRLFLVNERVKLRIETNCNDCEMKLYKI